MCLANSIVAPKLNIHGQNKTQVWRIQWAITSLIWMLWRTKEDLQHGQVIYLQMLTWQLLIYPWIYLLVHLLEWIPIWTCSLQICFQPGHYKESILTLKHWNHIYIEDKAINYIIYLCSRITIYRITWQDFHLNHLLHKRSKTINVLLLYGIIQCQYLIAMRFCMRAHCREKKSDNYLRL